MLEVSRFRLYIPYLLSDRPLPLVLIRHIPQVSELQVVDPIPNLQHGQQLRFSTDIVRGILKFALYWGLALES
jgi:hypothetical protein